MRLTQRPRTAPLTRADLGEIAGQIAGLSMALEAVSTYSHELADEAERRDQAAGNQLRSILEHLGNHAARDAELAHLRVRVAALERQLAAARAGDAAPAAAPPPVAASPAPVEETVPAVVKAARTSRAKTAAAKTA